MTTVSSPGTRFWRLRERLLGPDSDRIVDPAGLVTAAETIYGDRQQFRMYGHSLDSLIAHDFRLTGRTVLECCVDLEARPLAEAVRHCWQQLSPQAPAAVVDLFTGSGNLLYWVVDAVGAAGIGFESDATVFAATQHNLERLHTNIRVVHGSYVEHVHRLDTTAGASSIVLVDPPWGEGYDPVTGLDLTRTHPPIAEIFDRLRADSGAGPTLAVVKAVDQLSPASVRALRGLRGLRGVERLSTTNPRIRTVFFLYEL